MGFSAFLLKHQQAEGLKKESFSLCIHMTVRLKVLMAALNLIKLMGKAGGLMTLHLLESFRILRLTKFPSMYQQLCCCLLSDNCYYYITFKQKRGRQDLFLMPKKTKSPSLRCLDCWLAGPFADTSNNNKKYRGVPVVSWEVCCCELSVTNSGDCAF